MLDVLLRVDAHHEGGHINQRLANPDVTLLDHHASMVNRSGHQVLVHNGLQAAVQKLLDGEREDEIQLLLSFGQEADAGKAAQKGVTIEDALGVLQINSTKDALGILQDEQERAQGLCVTQTTT